MTGTKESMAVTDDRLIATLNHLVAACEDGELEYETAAKDVENMELKDLFERCAQQRAQFATELVEHVHRRGGVPKTGGTIAGALLRGWTNVKAAITGGSEHAVLTECDRLEHAALKSYERALEVDLPSDLREVVDFQHGQIRRAHEKIHALTEGSGG